MITGTIAGSVNAFIDLTNTLRAEIAHCGVVEDNLKSMHSGTSFESKIRNQEKLRFIVSTVESFFRFKTFNFDSKSDFSTKLFLPNHA